MLPESIELFINFLRSYDSAPRPPLRYNAIFSICIYVLYSIAWVLLTGSIERYAVVQIYCTDDPLDNKGQRHILRDRRHGTTAFSTC